MGVDEAGDDDPVRGVDHRGVVRHHDVRPDLADLAVLDQHVGLGEVADLPVEGQHHAALSRMRRCALQAAKLGPIALRQRARRPDCGSSRGQSGARFQKVAA